MNSSKFTIRNNDVHRSEESDWPGFALLARAGAAVFGCALLFAVGSGGGFGDDDDDVEEEEDWDDGEVILFCF